MHNTSDCVLLHSSCYGMAAWVQLKGIHVHLHVHISERRTYEVHSYEMPFLTQRQNLITPSAATEKPCAACIGLVDCLKHKVVACAHYVHIHTYIHTHITLYCQTMILKHRYVSLHLFAYHSESSTSNILFYIHTYTPIHT